MAKTYRFDKNDPTSSRDQRKQSRTMRKQRKKMDNFQKQMSDSLKLEQKRR